MNPSSGLASRRGTATSWSCRPSRFVDTWTALEDDVHYVRALAALFAISAASLFMGCMGGADSSEPAAVGGAGALVVWHCVAWPPGLPQDQHDGFGFSECDATHAA